MIRDDALRHRRSCIQSTCDMSSSCAVFTRCSQPSVLVLIYEDFRRDNEATVRQVLRFLEVDDTRPVEVTEANPTVRVRSPQLHKLVRSVYLGRGAVTRV